MLAARTGTETTTTSARNMTYLQNLRFHRLFFLVTRGRVDRGSTVRDLPASLCTYQIELIDAAVRYFALGEEHVPAPDHCPVAVDVDLWVVHHFLDRSRLGEELRESLTADHVDARFAIAQFSNCN